MKILSFLCHAHIRTLITFAGAIKKDRVGVALGETLDRSANEITNQQTNATIL
jgi:hypothetical protein